MTTRRSVMARKSVMVRLTPRQAFALLRATGYEAIMSSGVPDDDASRLFSVHSATASALYDDGWTRNEDGSWQKEVAP